MKVYLTAIVKAKAEQADTLKKVLQKMVVHSRKEETCLQYDLFQSSEDENIFVFNEIWANQIALDLHNEMPYIKDFVTASDKLTSEITIYKTFNISQ